MERLNIGLLGYCGLYCGDCPGRRQEIADAAAVLVHALEEARFDAVASSLFSEQLPHYAALGPTLDFLKAMRCPAVCRERQKPCDIGECCIGKGFAGCHECVEFESCPKFTRLERLHGDSCVANLRGIQRLGLEGWLARGRRKWFGTESDEGP